MKSEQDSIHQTAPVGSPAEGIAVNLQCFAGLLKKGYRTVKEFQCHIQGYRCAFDLQIEEYAAFGAPSPLKLLPLHSLAGRLSYQKLGLFAGNLVTLQPLNSCLKDFLMVFEAQGSGLVAERCC